jgi:hypothetical protein
MTLAGLLLAGTGQEGLALSAVKPLHACHLPYGMMIVSYHSPQPARTKVPARWETVPAELETD